jgi:hypothetical protein
MSRLWGLTQPWPWCSHRAASHGLDPAGRGQGSASHGVATARARPAVARVQPARDNAWLAATGWCSTAAWCWKLQLAGTVAEQLRPTGAVA